MTMATRKGHTPPQAVRKLSKAVHLLGENKEVAVTADHHGHLLTVAQPVRRAEGRRRQTVEGPRTRTLHSEKSSRRGEARESCIERDRQGNLLDPERRRAAVAHLVRVLGVRERFACRLPANIEVHNGAFEPPTPTHIPMRLCVNGCVPGRNPSTARIPPRLPRRPQRVLDSQSQENPTPLARRGITRAAAAPKRLETTTTTTEAKAPNRVWAVDFRFDASDDARPVKIVSIVDETHPRMLGPAGGTIDHRRRTHQRIAVDRSYPAALRCGNRPISRARRLGGGTGLLSVRHTSRPCRNGYIEWFSRRRRDECPNINSFWSLTQARVVISDWKEEYNHRRRDSGLGCNAPAGYATTLHPLQMVLTRGGPTTGSRHRLGYSDPVGAELVAGQPKSSPDRCPT